MPSSAKPRKKYRPKPVLADPVGYVVEGVQPVASHGSYLVDLLVTNHNAMEMLVKGVAKKKHMDVLIAMHNITEALYRMGFGRDYSDCVLRGKAALLDLCGRGAKTGRFVCRAAEIQALNDLMALADAQLEVITVADMQKAIALGKREIKAKRATIIKETA